MPLFITKNDNEDDDDDDGDGNTDIIQKTKGQLNYLNNSYQWWYKPVNSIPNKQTKNRTPESWLSTSNKNPKTTTTNKSIKQKELSYLCQIKQRNYKQSWKKEIHR